MVAVLRFLLAVFLATSYQATPHAQESFEQIAKKAQEARTSDHLSDAIALYAQAVRLRPSWTAGWWSLGSLLYDQDRFSEAQDAFAHFVKLSSRPGPGYAFLALCEYENRDYGGALEHFQVWSKYGSPGNDALLDVAGFHWALLLTREGRFNEALYLLAAKAQKLGGTSAIVEAMGLASLRMKNLPENYPVERREEVWLTGKSAFYSTAREPRRASEYADKLLAHYSSEPNVHYFRGTLLEFQKEYAAAEKEFEQELSLNPQNDAAMVELSLVKIEDFQAPEAKPLAQRAVALEPRNARAHYALGRAMLETRSLPEGASELEVARQLAPESSVIRFSLAKAYEALGRKSDAQQEYAVFRKLEEKENASARPPQRGISQKASEGSKP